MASIFGLALTASAQALTVSIDQAPARVAPSESFEVVWTVRSTSAVQQTTVLWGTSPGDYPNRGDIRSGPAGTFRTRLTAPATAGTLHWTVYVRTAQARGTTRARTIEVVGSAPTPAFGLERRVAPSLNIPLGGGPPSDWRSVVAFPRLTFSSPIFIGHAPDQSNRLFVVEQDGRVMVFPNDASTSSAQVFLDIRGRLRAGGEEGLLGLAFAPDYATSRRFYLYYSPRGEPRRTVVARYLASATNPDQAVPSSEEVLLTISQPFSNHNGGSMAFGPDGMLYVGVGDGGSGGDPMDNGQNRGTLLGKLLRVDVSGSGLRIPPDNPFVGTAGARGEIWAYGLRNPWRFSFDRATGDLWVGDIGQNAREEVDVVTRGGNYGWPVYEGTGAFRNPSGFPASAFKGPVVEYPASTGRSVIGGYVYRGDRYPAMRGAYFYADYVSDRVWALRRNAAGTANEWVREIATAPSPSSFGEDAAGELYVCSHSDGKIYRLEPRTSGGGGTPFPTRLSQTGVFRNLATLEASAGLIEYSVNSPLWSDGALKRRWLALPGLTSKIGFRPEAAWTFPTGTVLVKHFELETAPGTIKRLETRLLVNETAGWAGYTYRWNDAGTDADLLPGAATATFQVRDASAPGGVRAQEWYFPSRVDCMGCHTSAAGFVLGPRTLQLNREHDYPLRRDNQLRAMNNIGLFDTNVVATAHRAYPDPHDATKPPADRARAYLAVNCASCHLPGGPTPRQIDLRFETPRASMHALDATPLGGDLGLAGAKIIKPGARATSVLWERMRRRDFRGMPAIGSKRVDDAAVDLIGRWIDAGAP
jgi:uncharacterized repeat protein (TIGR03806 family)